MRPFLAVSKALGDETRARSLAALAGGELCLCQIIELLGLAPSTVSKHMAVLEEAGLVEREKRGRWTYFRWAGPEAPAPIREALAWTSANLADDPTIRSDRERLTEIRGMDLAVLGACCYRS